MRLDKILVEQGYARSRERARELIESGSILVNGRAVRRVSMTCRSDDRIELLVPDQAWVSRAGLKLEQAITTWPIQVEGSICLDIGASTGGFTQVLLHYGAQLVYALDVGTDQLVELLRQDPRVVVLEQSNIREVRPEWFSRLPSAEFDLITVDVSHISLKHVMPKVVEFLAPAGQAVVLVKPQFEVGKDRIGRGVVRDPDLHRSVLEQVKSQALELGLQVKGQIQSPITGVSGNQEFLLWLTRQL